MSAELVLAALGLLAVLAISVVALQLDACWLVSIGLALSIFSSNWGALGLPIGIDRIVIVAGIGLALARALRAGTLSLRPTAVHAVLLALSVYAIGSAVWVGTATDKGSAFALLDQLGLIPFLLFASAPLVFATREQRAVLVGVLAATGAYLALTGVAETLGARALVFPRYIDDFSLGIHQGRARGPFLEAAANGGAIATTAAVAALALVLFRDHRWVRYAVAVVLVAAAIAIVGTLTRQVWVSSTLSAVVVVLASARLRRYAIPLLVAGAIATVGSLALVPGLQQKVDTRTADKSSVWDRYNSNRVAGDMTLARPVLGFGWGRFASESLDRYTQAPNYPVSAVAELHNIPLSLLAELGVVGFVGWAAAVVLAGWAALRRRGPPELTAWQLSMVAIGLNWLVLVNFTPLRSAFTNYLVWTWLGVVAVVVRSYATERRSTSAAPTSLAVTERPGRATPAGHGPAPLAT